LSNESRSTVTTQSGSNYPLSVLVVDDDRDGAETLALLLQMSGYRVAVAADGETALETAALAPPDVVILDLLLPKLSGWDVARKLRERSVGKRPFFIAVSGCGLESDYRQSSEAGIDLHLLKPVDPPELMAVLDRFFRVLAPGAGAAPPRATESPQ
jgi:DNA-binding response OmpR family regulator